MAIRTLDDLDAMDTAVGVRVDINSPLADDGTLADDARLRAHVDTLAELLDGGARVAILAHQGRPGGDEFARLEPHADRLGELLDREVAYCDATFSADARDAVADLDAGEAVLLENTRFYSEEYMEFEPSRAAETFLVSRLAPALDAYVNDAFAAAHRSQPSLVGFPEVLPSYAGRVMEAELDVLGSIEETPTPRTYVVGGAKVPDSVTVAEHALEHGLAETVLVTGVVANVFLAASGVDVGRESTEFIHDRGYESEIERANALLDEHGDRIRLPVDVAVERDGERVELAVSELPPRDDEAVMDVGSDTIAAYGDLLAETGTAVLNGPAGVFEDDLFADGTRGVFDAATGAEYTIVGGGDTAAAIRRFGLSGFDHVSTGGGAALRLLTGESLAAVEALDR
ncbi:phosphoglycerate kinase [Halobacterium litoreum]|uniref:Phosphoglycerate kinase n=1 Tax=Halobacterium litoreum TaxID=2039234 RepID=A0ABD5NC01_9EURY|nr:phosphoglycerate kinase [Halobacterium litoreum]UHH14418.1 phosphoglycerate kinase [Halobacterium litoreum]